MNDYMKSLSSEMKQKKNLKDSTISNYIRSLKVANCNKNFDDLDFLNDKKQVDECLKKYKDGSQKAIITAICSVLNLYNKEKLHKHYYEKLMSYVQPPSNQKSDTQKENWIEWDEIIKIKNNLKARDVTQENRLKHMVLSLYTEIQPRRVLDYIVMYVVPKLSAKLPTDKNYLALKENMFVFNRYKTDKKYGQQKIEIPAELRKSIDDYIAQHPLKDQKMYPLLVSSSNEPFKGSNSITMMLNRIFKKKVSASMLRHIFLSKKYDIESMAKDAEIMGHSLNEQRNYMKKD